MSMVLILVLALAPVIITPGIQFYFDITPKLLIILAGTAALLPLAGPQLLENLRFHRELRRLGLVLGFAALSLTASTILSTDTLISLSGSTWRRYGMVTQVALLFFTLLTASSLAGSARMRWQVVRCMAMTSMPVALYGIVQYFGWDPLLPGKAYRTGEGIWTIVRPPGTLGHAAYFANFLLPCEFAAVALALLDGDRRWRYAGVAAAFLCVSAVVLSGTRAALVGLLAGSIYVWFGLRPRISRRQLAGLTFVVVAGMFFYWSSAGTQLRARTRWYREDALGGPRLLLWRDTLRMAARHWIFGWGPETFAAGFPRFESPALASAYPDFYHESAHNLYLDALSAQGVIGLLAMGALTALGFSGAARLRRTNARLAACLGAGWLAALVGHQFEVLTAVPALYVFGLLALISAAGSPDRRPAAWKWRPAVAFLPGSMALLLFGSWLALGDYSQWRARNALEAGDLAGALQKYHAAKTSRFGDDLWFARSAAVLARTAPNLPTRVTAWQAAAAAAERACTRSETPQNACYLLATLYAARDDEVATERNLRRAIEASPNWFKPHWMLAQVLWLRGAQHEARAEAALAATLDRGRNPEVAATLARIEKAL